MRLLLLSQPAMLCDPLLALLACAHVGTVCGHILLHVLFGVMRGSVSSSDANTTQFTYCVLTATHSWVKMLEMEDVDDLCLDFTITKESFGQTLMIELKEGGEDIEVDDDNKHEYIALLVGACRVPRAFI